MTSYTILYHQADTDENGEPDTPYWSAVLDGSISTHDIRVADTAQELLPHLGPNPALSFWDAATLTRWKQELGYSSLSGQSGPVPETDPEF